MAAVIESNSEAGFVFASMIEFIHLWKSGKDGSINVECKNGKASLNFSCSLGCPDTPHVKINQQQQNRIKRKSATRRSRDNARAAVYQARVRPARSPRSSGGTSLSSNPSPPRGGDIWKPSDLESTMAGQTLPISPHDHHHPQPHFNEDLSSESQDFTYEAPPHIGTALSVQAAPYEAQAQTTLTDHLQHLESISEHISSQLLKVLNTRRPMYISCEEFKKVVSQCQGVFTCWDEEYDKLQGLVTAENPKMEWLVNLPHKRLQERLEHIITFRQSHEMMRRDMAEQYGDEQWESEEVMRAYENVKEVDSLDITKEGGLAWERAMNIYDGRIDRLIECNETGYNGIDWE